MRRWPEPVSTCLRSTTPIGTCYASMPMRRPLDEVVTRPNTRGRQRVHYRSASQDFLDALGRSRVASRESFVGQAAANPEMPQGAEPFTCD